MWLKWVLGGRRERRLRAFKLRKTIFHPHIKSFAKAISTISLLCIQLSTICFENLFTSTLPSHRQTSSLDSSPLQPPIRHSNSVILSSISLERNWNWDYVWADLNTKLKAFRHITKTTFLVGNNFNCFAFKEDMLTLLSRWERVCVVGNWKVENELVNWTSHPERVEMEVESITRE